MLKRIARCESEPLAADTLTISVYGQTPGPHAIQDIRPTDWIHAVLTGYDRDPATGYFAGIGLISLKTGADRIYSVFGLHAIPASAFATSIKDDLFGTFHGDPLYRLNNIENMRIAPWFEAESRSDFICGSLPEE